MSLSYEEIAEILKAIDSSSCDELVVETGDVKLVVRRNGAAGAPAPVREPSAPAARARALSAAAPASAKPAPTPAAEIEAGVNQSIITAPMVGTFYRAPSPDAAPFVEIGSVVRKGEPVCIIEVMKLFTTINSECDGRVVEIGAENGELVEFGQTLFVVAPAA